MSWDALTSLWLKLFMLLHWRIGNDPHSSKRLGIQETPPASYGVQRDPPDLTFTARRDREGGGGCVCNASNPRWSYRCLRVSTYFTTSHSPPTNAPFPTLSLPPRWRRWQKKGAVDPCLCLLYMQPCEERHGTLLAPNLKCCWTAEQMFDKCTPEDLQCFICLHNYRLEMIGKLKMFSRYWARLDSFNTQVSCLKDGIPQNHG